MIATILLGISLLAGVKSETTSPAPFSGISVELRDAVQVRGTRFALGEVVNVSGENKDLIEKIKKIPVGYCPNPGFERKLLRAAVFDLIIGCGVSKADVQVMGANFTSVRTESSILDTAHFLQEGEKFLRNRLDGEKIQDYQIESRANPLALQVPVGKENVVLEPHWRGGYKDRGQVGIDLHILIDGEIYGSVPLLYVIHRYANAAVATKAITPTESLNEGNVEFRRMMLPEGQAEPILSADHFIGRKSSRHIRAGEIINQNDLRSVPLIQKDEEVILVAKSGALTVTMRGIAKSEGYFGAIISVENRDSKKQVQGKVVGPGRVEVNL